MKIEAIGWFCPVFGRKPPGVSEASYSAQLTYRQRIYKRWLFLEIEPGVEFPQVTDYEANPSSMSKLVILFGNE